jgi:hypothetical protein
MDEDFLLERATGDDESSGGRKKTRFELDLEKYGSIDAVRSAKTDSDEPEGVSMARRQGGSKAVNAALSQSSDSSSFDGQTDPDEFFDDDFSKYVLSANETVTQPEKEEVSNDEDDISSFSFDDNEEWAGKQKGPDFSALAEEVFDEEALIALGKSIKFGKDKNVQGLGPQKAEDTTYDSDEEFSPEGIVNTLSDRFAPFEFEPAPKPEVVVYEKNEFKPKTEPESEFKFEPEPEIKSEIKSELTPEPEKKPIVNAAAFAGLAEAVAAAEAAEAAGAAGTSSDDMDATPVVEVDDDTVFPAEPPIGYKKPVPPAPKTAREIAQEKIASGTARAATADEIKAETETKQTARPAVTSSSPAPQRPIATATSSTPAQAATAVQSTAPKAPHKEIVSLRELATGFNDAEYEKQTGTLPVLGELTDEFTGGKRISGKNTRTDDQIQLIRKQEALAMNILSEDSSNAGTVRSERIIYDLHERNEKKSRLVGRVLLITANLLLVAVALVGIFFYEGGNSGLAFLFRATIGIGVIGFIPFKFFQKLISPFMVLLSLLYVLLGLAGQDPIAANIAFYTVGVAAGLFGFAIRFFVPAVKSLFVRRKP